METPAGFDLLILNVEHTVKTKVVASRPLLQLSGLPPMVFLQEIGTLPPLPRLCFIAYTAIRLL